MPGFIYNLPWTTPGTLGLIMGTGFSIGSIILAILLLVVDVVMYYPFFKAYDMQKCTEEAAKVTNDTSDSTSATATNTSTEPTASVSENNTNKTASESKIPLAKTKDGKSLNVLVLCAGGGTSGILAKALNLSLIHI